MRSVNPEGVIFLSPSVKCLWAKSDPRHPLWKHMLDSAAVSLVLSFHCQICDLSPEAVSFVVGIHDIGKADAAFQHQRFELSDELQQNGFQITADVRIRHELLTLGFLKTNLVKHFTEIKPRVIEMITRAVAAHHGYWANKTRPVSRKYEEAQEHLCQMLHETLSKDLFDVDCTSDISRLGMSLTGHIVLCDWIASNEGFFCDPRLQDTESPKEYFEQAKKVAEEWIQRLGLARERSSGNPTDVVQTPRPIQRCLIENPIPPGLVIIEAPMGEGKTEAAWILAEKWKSEGFQGMYMALPTMATSDSLFVRYKEDYLRKRLSEEEPRLVHGMAWLRDDKELGKALNVGESQEDNSFAEAWFRPTRRAMLSPHGVGTIDQAMLAGMNVKFGFLRLYGLCGRVLVIDEVHAYDAYMTTIIRRLLQWCSSMKIPVVLLSATLSVQQRADLIESYGAHRDDTWMDPPYPLITIAESGGKARILTAESSSTKDLRIKLHSGYLEDADYAVRLAKQLVSDGGCCCIILNTVKQAQAVYRALDLPKDEKLLFHARYTASDRQQITEKVLQLFGKSRRNRPSKFVLVATQVVEQSLDVDFDHMISELAPIDLLLQRSGRLHRHSEREFLPTLHILVPQITAAHDPDFGSTRHIYSPKPLIRTMAVLLGKEMVHLPADFRSLIEDCYGSDPLDCPYINRELILRADLDWSDEMHLLENKAGRFILEKPEPGRFRPVQNDPVGDDSDDGNGWRASTRLGANDRTSILISEDEVQYLESGDLTKEEVRALYLRSLKLPSYLPLQKPSYGYLAAANGKGKLRGLTLLPVDKDGIWEGIDERGNVYGVSYDNLLGLRAGRSQ